MTVHRIVLSAVMLMLGAGGSWSNDLGIVKVTIRATSEHPGGYFTATHIGNGVLLTCGHCCRFAGGPGSSVEVDIISRHDRRPYRSETGTVLCLDAAADVGLIQLRHASTVIPAYRLAPPDYSIERGMPVLQYTWAPDHVTLSSVPSEVTSVNMFLGAANIETRHAPVSGDSGAPLVAGTDRVIIGVTTGADLHGQFGVHAGLEAVHNLLRECRARSDRSAQAVAARITR